MEKKTCDNCLKETEKAKLTLVSYAFNNEETSYVYVCKECIPKAKLELLWKFLP